MKTRAGGLTLSGVLAVTSAAAAQDVPAAAPPQVTRTPAPAPAPAPPPPAATAPQAQPSSAPAASASGASNSDARASGTRYTWHGAWRDRGRRSSTGRTTHPNTARAAGTPAASTSASGTPSAAEPPAPGVQPGFAVAPPPVVPTPRPRATPTPAPTMPSVATGPLWPLVAAAGLLVLLAAAWALSRLRRHDDEGFEAIEEEHLAEAEPPTAPLVAEPISAPPPPPPPTPTPAAAPPLPAPPPPAPPEPAPAPKPRVVTAVPVTTLDTAIAAAAVEPSPGRPRTRPEPVPATRPRLVFEFRPSRAGVNLLSATAEGEITVTNTGDAPADDVRAEMRLVSAHAGQDEEIAAIYVAPIVRSAVPPFTLAPGESTQVRLTAVLPRNAIRVLTASDRPMFVPLVVVNVSARGGAVQAGQAYAIGIERPGAGKLAPFWLDGPSRMYNSVAARAHGEPLER